MKRLFKISFDLALMSLTPIISWFCLGALIDRDIINVFTIIYPLQFISVIFYSLFSTGANISHLRDRNKNVVMSGLTLGIIVATLVFGFVIINVDSYISFMNMDVAFYRTFTIYGIGNILLQTIFIFVLNKLYYEEKNSLANRYSSIYNALSLVSLVGLTLVTKNQIVITSSALIMTGLFTFYTLCRSWSPFHFHFNLLRCARYESVTLANNLIKFLIFLFGLSTTLEFGPEYALAITFTSLITDTQWDALDAVETTAKIDLSKKRFNYKRHFRAAYALLSVLYLSIAIMFLGLYWFYQLDLTITLIYLGCEIVSFLVSPYYYLRTCFLQLEWSAAKTTVNKIIANFVRLGFSLLPTPYCTQIGDLSSTFYQAITTNFLLKRHYCIDRTGKIRKKSSKTPAKYCRNHLPTEN